VLTVDPNKRHGGLLTAIDHEENRFYVAEHFGEGLPESQHAAAYQRMLGAFKLRPNRDVAIYADPGGAGAQAIINLSEHEIFCQPVPKDAGSVKASIEKIRQISWIDPSHTHPLTGTPGAPHCYFLASLRSRWTLDGVDYNESRLMWELRQYRQKATTTGGVAQAPDTPVKEYDDLVDCMRYLELVRPFAPKAEDTTALRERAKLDRLSRKASEEFDEIVKKATQPRQPTEVW
jgi:hypothetical protein